MEEKRGWLRALVRRLGLKSLKADLRREELRAEQVSLELDASLTRTRSKLEGEAADRFEASQRAWEIYREAAMALEIIVLNGDVPEASTRIRALYGLVESRIADLEWKKTREDAAKVISRRVAAEEKLAAMIDKIQPFLTEKSRPVFEESQRTWEEYRDAQAAFRAAVEGSEIARDAALADLSRDQFQALDFILTFLDP